MPFELNEKIRNLVPYDPIAGAYPVRLDANESCLPVGEEERAALLEVAQGINLRRYPDHEARHLCQAAAAYYGTRPALLTAWNGTDEAILLLCTAFLGRGTALLSYALDFSMYHFNAYLTGADVIKLPKNEDFSIDVEGAIAALQQHKPEMFIFSNPCNPTSLVLPQGEVRRIIAAARECGTLVVLDEAYMDFCDQSLIDEVDEHENLVILRTCSKAPGLAGLRLGFSLANPVLTKALHAVKSPYNVGALTQAVGEAMLLQPVRLQEGVAEIRRRTDELARGLRRLGLRVAGAAANFVFVPGAARYFEPLKERGIVVRRFGEHLRITAGNAEENAALLSNLKQCMLEKG